MSQAVHHAIDSSRYAKCVEVSKRIRWDIDHDVIRGRELDFGKKFLPDGLSMAAKLPFLSAEGQRLFSQVQGRTYANVFGLVERFIGAKVLEISRGHWLGDQVALEALVRFTDEELKHQELFRRLETMIAAGMPPGYQFLPQPNDVAQAVLAASTWAVLALTCDIELFSQVHYRSSIDPDTQIDPALEGRLPVPLEGGVAACHARRDGMVARGRKAGLGAARPGGRRLDRSGQRRRRHLPNAGDGDAEYFLQTARRELRRRASKGDQRHAAWCVSRQYIVSGVQDARFLAILGSMIDARQGARINAAFAPIVGAGH